MWYVFWIIFLEFNTHFSFSTYFRVFKNFGIPTSFFKYNIFIIIWYNYYVFKKMCHISTVFFEYFQNMKRTFYLFLSILKKFNILKVFFHSIKILHKLTFSAYCHIFKTTSNLNFFFTFEFLFKFCCFYKQFYQEN